MRQIFRGFTRVPDTDDVEHSLVSGTESKCQFCLHYLTGTHKTTMFIYGRVGQPSHRAVYSTYMQICTNIK